MTEVEQNEVGKEDERLSVQQQLLASEKLQLQVRRDLLRTAQAVEAQQSLDTNSNEYNQINALINKGLTIQSVSDYFAQEVRTLYHRVLRITDSVEQLAIHEAVKTKEWVLIQPDLPPPSPGKIRLYRGVKPIAIDTEFAPALTTDELSAFEKIIDDAKKGLPLSSDQQNIFQRLSTRVLNHDAKSYTDNLDTAYGYAEHGVVLYMDLTPQQLANYRRENRKPESLFMLPREMVAQSEPFAVGSQVHVGTTLKPRKL